MFGNLTGWHFLVLFAVILLLFGAAKLPALAKSVGQSARIFKGEMRAVQEEDAAAKVQTRAEKRAEKKAAAHDAKAPLVSRSTDGEPATTDAA